MTYNFKLIALLFVLFLLNNSCADNTVTPPNNTFIESVTDTWIVNQESLVTLDGQDITATVIGFEITINSNLNFTTTSNIVSLQPFPWPMSGSFQANDQSNQFTRNDGLIIGVLVNQDDCLTLSFQFDTGYQDSTGGRTRGITGEWSMQFKRK